MKKTGAGLNRHRSNQAIGTPPEFIAAVERRFGQIAFDLAADDSNRVTLSKSRFFSEKQNSLVQDWWKLGGNLWLNPPFANITPWASKCAGMQFRSAWTLLLVPASVGSQWFQRFVAPHAHVFELTDRIQFVGSSAPYPKDLILAAFGYGVVGRSAWAWDDSKKHRK